MSEIEAPTLHPFAVKGKDGETHAGAADQQGAIVLAGALYVSASMYHPLLSVVEVATDTVVAVIGKDDSPPAAAPAPVIEALDPVEATFPGQDVTLQVHGHGFVDGSVIVFNTGDEETVFVGESLVTTGIDISTVEVETTVPVQVRNPDGEVSNSADFSFVRLELPEEDA